MTLLTTKSIGKLIISRSLASSTSYDAVIIGGGHNGLVASVDLAKAGKKVINIHRNTHSINDNNYAISHLRNIIKHEFKTLLVLILHPIHIFNPFMNENRSPD